MYFYLPLHDHQCSLSTSVFFSLSHPFSFSLPFALTCSVIHFSTSTQTYFICVYLAHRHKIEGEVIHLYKLLS